MKRDQRVYLLDILEAIDSARQFVRGMSFEDFKADQKTHFAVVRAIEIIGEAAKRLDPDLRRRYDHIPWNAMAGMRDVLIHGYQDVQLERVWAVVQERFPIERPWIQQVLNEIPSEEE